MSELKNKKYMFTNKNYSSKSIMSAILGLISAAALIYAVYLTYAAGGRALPRYGASLLLTTIFAFVGLILGILAKMEPETFYLFAYIGLVLNILVLLGISFVLYAGAYGL